MKYQIKNLLAFIEEDNYQNGLLLDDGTSKSIDITFCKSDIRTLINEVADFLNIPEKNRTDHIELNACEEIGRIDFVVTENTEGHRPSESEIKQWKQGKTRLFYCVYTGTIEQILIADLENIVL